MSDRDPPGSEKPPEERRATKRRRKGISELARWMVEYGLLHVKTPEEGRSQAALWHFLRHYRECCPQILADLASGVLPVHTEWTSGRKLGPSLAEWWVNFGLPRTGSMHREALNTLEVSAHTLERPEPRWAFEWVVEHGEKFLRLESEPSPWLIIEGHAAENALPREVKLELPPGLRIPFPPQAGAPPRKWDQWRSRAGREVMRQFETLWSYTPDAIVDFAGSASIALKTFEREEPTRLRDLKWLALKQSGLSAGQIADQANQEGEVSERAITEDGVWKAVRRAADELGLARELIRRAEPGRKPSP